MMVEAPDIVIPEEVFEERVQCSFHVATKYLRSTVSYIWIQTKDEGQVSKYTIEMWSRKVTHSEFSSW